MSKIKVLVNNLTTIGEGPHYDEGFLYYVDIIGNSVGRYDIGSGKNVFIKVSRLQIARDTNTKIVMLYFAKFQQHLHPGSRWDFRQLHYPDWRERGE